MFGTAPYNQARNFAACCTVEQHFLEMYGTEEKWQDRRIDLGELMDFIESILNAR